MSQNDVRYGIADCRKRLRNQRATLRAHHYPPTDVHDSESKVCAAGGVQSYAEILASVSMSQSSLSKLVECLLDSSDSKALVSKESEQEEAAIT